MLCEIECRALCATHTMLVQDFEPNDALPYMEGNKIFTEDHVLLIQNKPSRLERLGQFLRLYRRQASELGPLIEFFKYNNQLHIAKFLENFLYLAINDPDQLRPVMIAPQFTQEMLKRKLLFGNVPRQITSYCRHDIVDSVIDHLEEFSDLDCFFVVLHGRAGSGKSVIASQAVSISDVIVGVCFESIIWVHDGGVLGRSAFELFSDLYLMLKSEDDLQTFPCIENVTSSVLKKMIANALIDRPNTLFVIDDVVLEDTIRWAQELRLRCLITTRDVEIANVITATREYVEVSPCEPVECEDLMHSFGMPLPSTDEEEQILSNTIKLTSGNAAVLSIMDKLCDKRYDRMAQLNNRLRLRGLSALECVTPYRYNSLDMAFKRCVEILSDEDREALAYCVVVPPDVDVPIYIWTCIIPVEVCSDEDGVIEEEVIEKLNRLSRKGHWLTGIRRPTLCYKIDNLVHTFLRHVVDSNTILRTIDFLREKLLELRNNNNRDAGDSCDKTDYGEFMEKHKDFYESLRNLRRK